ncbi:hypothetical protein DPMN_149698 [Dreissena polymorpha]|uniref:Uncharacterized protein n=1 Tax=Dreissena polymorpha TaxID=45954 RepID=A0A9D4J1C3_DREPO|nr:hypothetical protein DPMN_149698 [Dreissena polymorpha]
MAIHSQVECVHSNLVYINFSCCAGSDWLMSPSVSLNGACIDNQDTPGGVVSTVLTGVMYLGILTNFCKCHKIKAKFFSPSGWNRRHFETLSDLVAEVAQLREPCFVSSALKSTVADGEFV